MYGNGDFGRRGLPVPQTTKRGGRGKTYLKAYFINCNPFSYPCTTFAIQPLKQASNRLKKGFIIPFGIEFIKICCNLLQFISYSFNGIFYQLSIFNDTFAPSLYWTVLKAP